MCGVGRTRQGLWGVGTKNNYYNHNSVNRKGKVKIENLTNKKGALMV